MSGMSIVVPFLNELDGITMFMDALDEHQRHLSFPLELVFVDDGSTDGTGKAIISYSFVNIKKVKLITLSKNFGSHAAIRAGVQQATYDICTWMGSDLQEPIDFLALSYCKLEEGYDSVYIEKKSIDVSITNRGFSKIYSKLMRKYAVKNYSSGGISNIVFNGKIKNLLNTNIETNSSIMLQIMDAGFRYTTLSMEYKARVAGTSKWTLSKKVKLLIDSFVAFSFAPLRFVTIIGFILFFLGIFFGLWVIVRKIVDPISPAGYSTLACLISIGFGITNISLGIIAEYLWRTYDAARNHQAFIVQNVDILLDHKNSVLIEEREVM